MSVPLARGSIQFSVDFATRKPPQGPTLELRTRLAFRLREMFAEHGIPLTCHLPSWADPIRLQAPTGKSMDRVQEEIGWSLYDGQAEGSTTIPELRKRIDRELDGFRTVGQTVRSVAIPSTWMRALILDHLAAQQVTALRGDIPTRGGVNLTAAKMVRQGVWYSAVAAAFPQRGGGIGPAAWDDAFAAKSAVVKAAQQQRGAHIAIQLEALSARGERGWRALAKLLRRISQFQSQGRLDCQTMSGHLQARVAAKMEPATSILRAA